MKITRPMERVEYSETGSRCAKNEEEEGSLSLCRFFKEGCVPSVVSLLCFCCKSGDTRSLKGFWDWIKDVLHGKAKQKVLKVIERKNVFLSIFHQTNLYSDQYLVFVYNIKEFIIIMYVRFFFKIHTSFIFIKILLCLRDLHLYLYI